MEISIEEKVQELSVKYGISQRNIKKIFYSQFEYVSNGIREDYKTKPIEERRTFSIPFIGKWKFNILKVNYINKAKEYARLQEKRYGENMAEAPTES